MPENHCSKCHAVDATDCARIEDKAERLGRGDGWRCTCPCHTATAWEKLEALLADLRALIAKHCGEGG